jgi:hypothetical protein
LNGFVIYESTFRSQELQFTLNAPVNQVKILLKKPNLFFIFRDDKVFVRRFIEIKIYLKQSFELLIKITQVSYFNKILCDIIFVYSGVISMQEFTDTCTFLGNHNGSKLDKKQIMDLAASIDLDKNGVIDFNEFLEAFRIVDIGDHSPNHD